MGGDTRKPRRQAIVTMVAIGLTASVIGIIFGLLIDWFPEQGSKQADKIDTLWDLLLICSVPIFVLVTCVVLFSVVEFRQKPGEENLDGPPIHGNTRLEIVWTAIPSIILVTLCTYAAIVLQDIEQAPANGQEARVGVTGEQFTWTFEYTGGDGKKFSTNQLYVKQGQSVRFDVRSKDVLHDFWVPQWRMKIDAVPGITTGYRVTPTRTGVFPVVCAELCGLGHAFMRQSAHVLTPAAFDKWMADMTAKKSAGAAAPAAERRFSDRFGRRQGPVRRRQRRLDRLRELPHPGRRRDRRPDRTEPRRGAGRQGRSVHQDRRSWTPTRRSPRASVRASCRRTTARP